MKTIQEMPAGRKFLAIFMFAVLFRLCMALIAVTVASDSVIYLYLAGNFSSMGFGGLVDWLVPPGYPFTVAIALNVVDDPEFAGRLVAMFFSSLTVPLVYYLCRRLYDEKIALTAAFFVAVHYFVVRYSGEVLTEGLYGFLLAAFLIFAIKGVRDRSFLYMALAGLFSSFAYLTRPEGAGLLGLLSVWLFVDNIRALGKDWFVRVKLLCVAWAVFLVAAAPYIYHMYDHFGEARISGKLTTSNIVDATSGIVKNEENISKLARNFMRTHTWPFFVLFAAGLYARFRRERRSEDIFLFVIWGAYTVLYTVIRPDSRYFVEHMAVFLIFSSAGFIYFVDSLAARSGWNKRALIVAVAVLVALTAMQLRKTYPVRAHQIGEITAGKWFKENVGPGQSVSVEPSYHDHNNVFVYFAGAKYVPRTEKTVDELVRSAKEKGVIYVAGYVKDFSATFAGFDAQKKNYLEEVKYFSGESSKADYVIYRIK
ncbi:MAG: glycosyltransferase family 39 protein [Deltaproteobacteria bacterium]|nr:glycosyltransferase family 39 protein [Deltaproteobacteria bacterium]